MQSANENDVPSAGQTYVVKLGGEIMLNTGGLDALAADIAQLSRKGVRIVVVHGGGPQADALAEKLGHTVRKVAGRRITDDDALEVAKMVYGGSINAELLAALSRHGARAVGLSGIDGQLITVEKRPPVKMRDPQKQAEEWVDFGHVGDVREVDIALLSLLLGNGYVPVVASLAADTQGHIYNVNADTIAQALAASLEADGLVLLTNVPGILRDVADPTSLVPRCTSVEIAQLVESGIIKGGMLPKVHNCIEALNRGVKQVTILDGTADRSYLAACLAGEGVGTIILPG